MSAIDIRSSITVILDNATDEEILDAYYQILLNLIRVQNRTIVAYNICRRSRIVESYKSLPPCPSFHNFPGFFSPTRPLS